MYDILINGINEDSEPTNRARRRANRPQSGEKPEMSGPIPGKPGVPERGSAHLRYRTGEGDDDDSTTSEKSGRLKAAWGRFKTKVGGSKPVKFLKKMGDIVGKTIDPLNPHDDT